MNIKEIIKSAVADYEIQLNEAQYEQLERYFQLLIVWNEKINLTAITDEEGVAVKHFADSLSLFNCVEIPENASVIDVGTGAGFPGVVLKIARPDIKLTLLDSLKKGLYFLTKCFQNFHLKLRSYTAEPRTADKTLICARVSTLLFRAPSQD